MQLSNKIYCDSLFETIKLQNCVFANMYEDYPYLIIEDFFSQELCKQIVDSLQSKQNGIKAKVKSTTTSGIVIPDLKEKYRKTNILKLEKQLQKLYDEKFLHIQPKIEEFFKVPLTFSTKLQVLEYKEGFFYTKHSDDSSELIDEMGQTVGFVNVAPNRKLTTVLFGTSFSDTTTDPYHFSGGELIFNYLYNEDQKQIKLKPKAGTMLVFPSNPIFSHEVAKVISGYRLTMVQWHDVLLN
ncbi:MAG: 2OG-Fe(II) oxygenase [Campylobacterales bacterium]|nr:2OG-Fe(II) oxygenase [Campylobacterales bacterium]